MYRRLSGLRGSVCLMYREYPQARKSTVPFLQVDYSVASNT
jgi:hypothetical protein